MILNKLGYRALLGTKSNHNMLICNIIIYYGFTAIEKKKQQGFCQN